MASPNDRLHDPIDPQDPFDTGATAELTTSFAGRPLPTAQQLDLLGLLVDESGRRTSVQLPGAFAFAEGGVTPLGALLRMGDAGLRLYITLVAATRQEPHELWHKWPAARLARMLGYDQSPVNDHASTGTRKIQRTLSSLMGAQQRFVTLSKQPGYPDRITVNHFGAGKMTPPYVTVGLDLWRQGWIVMLTKRGLAVYLALRHQCAGKEDAPFQMTPRTRAQYGISPDTWSRGEADLVALNLLEVSHGVMEQRDAPERSRRTYRLTSQVMKVPPAKVAEWNAAGVRLPAADSELPLLGGG